MLASKRRFPPLLQSFCSRVLNFYSFAPNLAVEPFIYFDTVFHVFRPVKYTALDYCSTSHVQLHHGQIPRNALATAKQKRDMAPVHQLQTPRWRVEPPIGLKLVRLREDCRIVMQCVDLHRDECSCREKVGLDLVLRRACLREREVCSGRIIPTSCRNDPREPRWIGHTQAKGLLDTRPEIGQRGNVVIRVRCSCLMHFCLDLIITASLSTFLFLIFSSLVGLYSHFRMPGHLPAEGAEVHAARVCSGK